MADEKNDDLEINLKSMGLDDGDNPADLESFYLPMRRRFRLRPASTTMMSVKLPMMI